MRYYFLTFLGLSLSFSSFGQKKVVDHTVYNSWKSISNQILSPDGSFVVYKIKPHEGDGWLYIKDLRDNSIDSIHRVDNASIAGDGSFVAFKIDPGFDTLRTCELDKIDKKKWPKDSLGIWIFENDSLSRFERIKSYVVSSESGWMYYTSEDNKVPSSQSGKKKKKRKKKNQPEDPKSDGTALFVLHPSTGTSYNFKNVKLARFSETAKFVAYTTHEQTNKVDSVKLFILDTKSGTSIQVGEPGSDIVNFNFNKNETRLAFLYSADTAKAKNYQLFEFDLRSNTNKLILDTISDVLSEENAVSKNATPYYSDNDFYLYFGVAKKNRTDSKDTLLASEKAKFDLWHYNDRVLQPQQLKELKRDLGRTNLYVLNISQNKIYQLGDDTLSIQSNRKGLSSYLIGESEEQYIRTYNWEYPHHKDLYLVSLEDGSRRPLQMKAITNGDLSPKGNYFVSYHIDDRQLYLDDIKSNSAHCITCGQSDVNWLMDLNGQPMESFPFSIIGWTKDEKEVWLKSEFDLWSYSTETKELISLTHFQGLQNEIKLSANLWDYDSVYLDLDNIYVTGFNEKTKGTHFYEFKDHGDHLDLNETAYYDASIGSIKSSKNRSRVIFTKETFRDFPDLFSTTTAFKNITQISNANPQISEYNWGSVELTTWTSNEGVELDGLIYKPDNFDPSKSYPMLIYYYELRSDALHTHYMPKPTASIIYPGEYTSAGYVVFIPDIKYTPGYPARSAYDCIMSGTDHVLSLYSNIDSTRMGLQGQSWGGYQTAQLVTMTTRYKAAMAGAPVSNMFSAYGGIRWGSGMNRQFQYEHSQSRIGHTIWERPDLYFENSPLFHVPNIETPLLIMHNDDDGAVPWYQGIELFTAMRRLNKEVWMLTYNDDGHNLMKNANRIDLSIRMRQFFDYYLLDKEAPQWLTEGIPATVKGKELRY